MFYPKNFVMDLVLESSQITPVNQDKAQIVMLRYIDSSELLEVLGYIYIYILYYIFLAVQQSRLDKFIC